MKVGGNAYADIGSAATITTADTNQAVTLTDEQIEAAANYAEGGVLTFTAIITDSAGNATTGTASSTTLTVDQSAPTISETTVVPTPSTDTTPTVVMTSNQIGAISSPSGQTLTGDVTAEASTNSVTFAALAIS